MTTDPALPGPAGGPVPGGRPEGPDGGLPVSGVARRVAPEGELRRLHALTPFIRGWRLFAVLAAAVGQEAVRNPELGRFAYGALLVIPVAALYGLLSWWFTRYRIEASDLRLETGVLFRRTRHVRLERLQAVDVVRPLLARFVGLAELRLEVAGGNGAEASLAYLAEPDAQRLRAELLARAAGMAPETAEAPERVLVRVPTEVLLVSIVLSIPLALGVVGGVALVVIALVSGELEVVLGGVPIGLALAGAAFNRFTTNFDFVVADSPDGVRLRHGLLEHRSQTVPPGRVQALRIIQPVMWRQRDWVRVQVGVAGYAGRGEGSEQRGDDLLPVAPRAAAAHIVTTVLPGVAVDEVPMRGVPRRARFLRPLTWRALACGADGRVFVSRRGLLRRQCDVIPHGKIQSVRLRQGPLQRRLGLGSVYLDTTPGPVSVVALHRDLDEATRIVAAEVKSSGAARRAAGPERWMTRPGGEAGVDI